MALIDVEVYDPSGTKVIQRFWDRQPLLANSPKSFAASFTLPVSAQAGSWTVKIGAFVPGWGGLLGWNNGATSFTVK